MEISITPAALKRIREIRSQQNVPNSALLRVGVVSGGCSGLSYELNFDENTQPAATDHVYEIEDIRLFIDMRSFLYLAGTELDYSEGFEGKGFHFNNPNASRTCSCGESFSL